MGIRVTCPNGHKLHVKSHLAGKRGICPKCGASTPIPAEAPAAQVGVLPSQASQFDRFDSAASIVISVAAPPTPVVAPSIQPPPIILPAENPATPAPAATSAPESLAKAPVTIEPTAPESAATKYVAHRARSRRNQLAITIVLLTAVIVLAVVLIWVLRRGASQASSATAAAARLASQVESQ